MVEFLEFWNQQGVGGFIRIFWFYFLFEFPRYILLDYVFLLIFKLNSFFNKESYEDAREKLWADHPLITIIIPGKDEGANYYRLVRSLEEQTYQNFQLIIVDDGSEDESSIIGRKMQKEGLIDLFLRNDERGGKASAANLGLRYAKGKFAVHLDADSSFYRDAIEEVLIPFYQEENVGAVGGTLEVRNSSDSLATHFQSVEYLLNFTVGRMVASSLRILRVISGAFGVFRTDVLKEIGGWDVGPGMDGDITLKIRKIGYKVEYTPKAVCLTNVPVSFRKLTNQRIRWSRSLVRFRFRKHRDFLFPSSQFRLIDFWAVVDNVFYNFVLNFLWWIYLFDILIHYTPQILYIFVAGSILYTVSKFIEFGVVPILSSNKSDKVKLLAYIPGMTFYTGFYIRFVRTYAYIKELFFHDSYKDEWNPEKTSNAAREVEDRINTIFSNR